jgi:hypothetical protein
MPAETRLRVVSPPGVDQKQEEPLELAIGQSFTVDLGLDKRRRDVVGRAGPLLPRHAVGIGEHLDHGFELALRGDRGGIGRVHDLGQRVEALAVDARDAHELGDEPRGQPAGHVGH